MPARPGQSEGPCSLVPLGISRLPSADARQGGRNSYPRGGGSAARVRLRGGTHPPGPRSPPPDPPRPLRAAQPPYSRAAAGAGRIHAACPQDGHPCPPAGTPAAAPSRAGGTLAHAASSLGPSRSAIHGRPLLMPASPGLPCPVGLPRAGLLAVRAAFTSPSLFNPSSRSIRTRNSKSRKHGPPPVCAGGPHSRQEQQDVAPLPARPSMRPRPKRVSPAPPRRKTHLYRTPPPQENQAPSSPWPADRRLPREQCKSKV